MPEENIVAANTEELANPQETTQETTGVESAQSTQAETEKAPEVTQTQAFSQRLKEATQKAIDSEYERLYGEHGIRSKSDYDAYLERQKLLEEGKDPELYTRLNNLEKENQEFKREKMLIEQDRKLETDPEYGDLYKSWREEIKAEAEKHGADYETVFTYFCRRNLKTLLTQSTVKAEQSAIEKITQNATTSPGALGQGGENTTPSIKNMSREEFLKFQEAVLRGEIKNV